MRERNNQGEKFLTNFLNVRKFLNEIFQYNGTGKKRLKNFHMISSFQKWSGCPFKGNNKDTETTQMDIFYTVFIVVFKIEHFAEIV